MNMIHDIGQYGVVDHPIDLECISFFPVKNQMYLLEFCSNSEYYLFFTYYSIIEYWIVHSQLG